VTKFRFITAVMVMTLAVLGDPPAQGKDPELIVKGVGLGSAPSAIRASLGLPEKQVALPGESEMGMGKLRELHYPGLKLELCQPPEATESHVWRFTVTGQGYAVEPGLRVGMEVADVRRILGPPSDSERNPATGRETLHYSFTAFDGWYWVAVVEGKVVEIGATEDWS
jgi:hypothetical protein